MWKNWTNKINAVVAIDSFKGSLSAFQSGKAVKEAMDINNAYENLKSTAEQVFKLIKVKNYE